MVKKDAVAVPSVVKESNQLPQCLKAIEEMAAQLRFLLEENGKLRQENSRVFELERENNQLREQIRQLQNQLQPGSRPVSNSPDMPPDNCNLSFSHESDPFHEQERLRSIVISGVRELQEPIMTKRLDHDYCCVMNVLSFLGVECYPTAIYRLGKPISRGARKIKVVLPSTIFRTLAVRRAPLLRSFPVRGVSLRESLPLAERIRRKGLRPRRNSGEASLMASLMAPPPQNPGGLPAYAESGHAVTERSEIHNALN